MKNFKLNLKSIVQSNAREKKRKEKDERVLTMKEASVQHPFSIHSASIQHPLQSGGNQEAKGNQEARGYAARVWKYAAMLLMLLTIGVGQMWGNYAYLDLTGTTWWYNDGAAFRLDKNGTGNVDSYTEIGSTGVWRFNIGDYTGTATFKRMNSGRTSQWNYANVTISSTANVFHTENDNGVTTRSFVIDYIHGTNHVYFDNSTSNFTGNIYLVIGHDYSPSGSSNTYSKAYKMTKVSNTSKLWYVSITDEWADATYYAIIGNSAASISETSWGSSSLSSKGTGGYTAAYKTVYNMEGGSFLITTASSGNNKAMTITYKDGYGSLPKLDATQSAKKRDTGTSYTTVSGNWPATINLNGTYMSGNGATSRSEISSTKSSDEAAKRVYGAIKTGLITHSYTSLSSDYYFEGWGTGDSPSSTSSTYEYNITSATTVYSFYSKLYTLGFDVKGTPGSSTIAVSVANYDDVDSGDEVPTGHTITATATIATGYEIVGWYSDASCTSAYTNGSGGVTISGAGNKNFSITSLNSNSGIYCKFQKKTYSVTLDDDGDYGGNGSATVQYGDGALTISSHARRDGWNLLGYWNSSAKQVTDAEGNLLTSVSGYTDGSGNWIYDGDVTLYAHWSQSYSVTYNANGGSGSMSDPSSPYEAGSNVTVLSNSFTRSGYSFTGWNTSAEGDGTPYAAGATISSIAANVTLYAQWSENDYTVTVTAGSNGSVASGSVTGHKDTKVTLPTATANTGYHFSTWTTTSGSVTYTNQTSATTAQVNGLTAAATVRADFAANTYSVVFNANGGSGSMSNQSFTYNAAAKALTSNSFTRSGYTFVGWATSAARASAMNIDYTNGQSVRNLTSTNEGTFNLYAVWAKKYYIGGRFQQDWNDGTSTSNELTYDATTGYYKYATSKTVNELSVQWHNTAGNYDADQVFFIHTGNGKNGSSSNPFYTTPNEDGAGLNFETSNSYANALVLANQEVTWSEIVTNRLVQFSNVDNLSSDVIVWWDPANKKIWYTATESLNTNYYLLGFGEGSWSETDARRFKVASVNASTATVTVSLTAKTYAYNTNDGFKVENGGTYYGNNSTMTRANCTGWVFEAGNDYKNCGITADVAGTYTFTLNLSTKAVSVTYPAETMYDVTINAETGGTVSYNGGAAGSSCTARAGISTASANIVATASEGYYFVGWQFPDGTVTKASESEYDGSTSTLTINATADGKTVTALFNVRYALLGSQDNYPDDTPAGMPDWGDENEAPFSYSAGTYTKTVDLTVPNTNYKFRVVDRRGASHTSYGLSSKAVIAADGNYHDLASTAADALLATAGVGTYTLYVQTNGSGKPKVKIVNPTSYLITMGTTTYFNGGASSETATSSTTGGNVTAVDGETIPNPIVNGSYIKSGGTVIFTAAPSSGYTFAGWYSNSSCSSAYEHDGSSVIIDGATLQLNNIGAAKTVYAKFTEDMHTVTVTSDAHGTINKPVAPATTVSAGITTSAPIQVTGDYGYYFTGWTIESGDVTFGDASNTSTTVNATSDATIKANFVSHWTIAGSKTAEPSGDPSDPMGDWSQTANGIDDFTQVGGKWYGHVDIELPANTLFYFKVRDLHNTNWYGNTGTMDYGNHTDWVMSKDESANCRITTAGAGTYTFTWNETDTKLTVTYPTSYTVTFGKVVDNGQNIGGVSATGDDDSTLVSGKYVAKGSATFTAAEAEYYSFVDWRTSSTYGGGDQLSTENPYTMTSIAANKTVYANYAENMTTVNLAATNGKIQYWDGDSWEDAPSSKSVGVFTTCSIKAVPNTGYYFAGWENTEGTDYSITGAYESESNNNTTLSGNGAGAASGQTLTANFVELDKIYFRNIFDDGEGNVSRWSDVYVYYDITWNEGKVRTNSNSSYIAHMSQIAGKDVYWAYVPRAFTVSNNKNVAFSDTEFTTDYDFYNATASGSKAAARGDYNKALNMFVPNHTAKSINVNGVDYFDNGYWMKYDTRASQGAGYYLKKYKSRNNYWQMGEYVATADDATAIRFTIRVDNTSTDSTKFMIVSAGGLNYIAESAISSTDYTKNVYENLSSLSDNDIYFQLNLDTEGDYTFILDQSGDVMKLTVDFPVNPGDYRLKHTYNDGTDKTTYSDVIKSNVAGSGKTLSMYLSSAGSGTLVLQKCERIDGTTKQPVWSSGYSDNLDGILTKVGTDGNSVYQFDITINTTTHKVSAATNIKKYDGPFYIKTNCADGGWINYNQNTMGHNTINFDPAVATTFDYYFCKWIDNTETNVKCVIANDYCNQISDTLKSDAILNRRGIAYETLPYASNVRFSYNSSTNELKRSYLLGSTDANSFLYIVPSANGLIYATDGTTDLNTLPVDNANRKFKDNGNWTYQMDVKIYPSACGGVYSNYPTVEPITTQHFLETTNVLMGGSYSAETKYHVRLIYDYKTNNLVAAWLPDGDPEKAINLQADFMMLRDGQNSASHLSFGGDYDVTNAHRAYGAFEFKKDEMVGKMGSWDATSYGLCMYYFSFPFDVNVSDIFGAGTMGVDWRLQRYNGAKRAEKGWFLADGTTTFWEDLSEGDVLHAYEGYSLLLNRVKFNTNGGENNVWVNIPDGGSIYLIFPSASNDLGTIASGTKKITVPSHECTIDRFFEQDRAEYYDEETDTWRVGARNHKMTDSHWNMVGAPVFQNLKANGITEGAQLMPDSARLQYVFTWNSADNTLSVRQALNTDFMFNSMFAYMVQYAGDVTFEGASINPTAAPRRTPSDKLYTIELELSKGETFAGRTYVELRENAVDSFQLNEDMYMMRNSRTADIYTYAGGYDVAANVLSIGNHTIPVGINVKSAGTYTFSMPNIFSGTVTLVDTYTQERTNLSLNEYEVTLPKGEINDRFYLEINLQEVITSIENVDGNNALNDNKAHKFIKNDQMYILKNGVIYDARGAMVK